jgi:hypothetical protein
MNTAHDPETCTGKGHSARLMEEKTMIIKEPYEQVILKNGVEVVRETYIEDVAYCDDCGEQIPGYRTYDHKNDCCICEKQICDNHRHPFPSADHQGSSYGNPEWVCERCKTTYANEIKDYILYLTTLKGLEDSVIFFKKEYGEKKIKGYSPMYFSSYIKYLAKDIRDKQVRSNKDKARKREKKLNMGKTL